ncbi:MAG: hypothetical protein HC781_19215 [Leptolyngbyaceae cyanobacterium CSU_1_4]|nr:hypothetical protein [Leptolyngbyaceae cyanobacterium CSU_1_4]
MNETEHQTAQEPTQEPQTENTKSEVIRDLVTHQEEALGDEETDRSPTKTERPLPLELIQQALDQTETTIPPETVRKPLSP